MIEEGQIHLFINFPLNKYKFLSGKFKSISTIYIENLAFLFMPFLDLAFLSLSHNELIITYGMMLPWFFITEISINSIVILVSGEEITHKRENGRFFKRRIKLAVMIVTLINITITIIAAAITAYIIAPIKFWFIFLYFVVFTIGFAVYAQRKMAAIEVTSLGNPSVALTGSILGVCSNLGFNILALQVFETKSLYYVLAIASSTIIAYFISWFYIRLKITDVGYYYPDEPSKLSSVFSSILRPLTTQFACSLELISSQAYTLVIITLLFAVSSEFVYVRSFLAQFFLFVTATGIAVSIYCNNIISEIFSGGKLAVRKEIQQNIAYILIISFLQAIFVVAGIYALFQLGFFGTELSYIGIQSLIVGVFIYAIYEPLKATNIMLLTAIRRLHMAAVPTAISVTSNAVAVCCAILVTLNFESEILIFTTIFATVFAEELFRCSVYNWYLKSKLTGDEVYG
ncbi:hypothetical protein [Rhizobium sp. FKY42]|uniref:hypothetical protein n=1 Tax=Rhizobium sp. FKY42 TaxID=2562310 RepID=UPI0010C0C1E7|nr:hypothetical protein [Rhizobium sp. FKY42]